MYSTETSSEDEHEQPEIYEPEQQKEPRVEYKNALDIITDIHIRKSSLTKVDTATKHWAVRINAEYELTKAILCELIWRCNLNPTQEQYTELLGSENIQKLQLYVSKLWDETIFKPAFNDEDFVFIHNNPIDLNNITSSAEGIVLRKIVSEKTKVSLNERLKSACCVVFVERDNCERCNDAVHFLKQASSDDDRVVVVDINTLAKHIQESLYDYSVSLPIIFIGEAHITYDKLKRLKTKDLQARLATCRGKRWQ